MPDQVVNYQCPACTGPLHFASGSGQLECEYCGSSFSVEEVESFYAEKARRAAEAAPKAGKSEGATDTIEETQIPAGTEIGAGGPLSEKAEPESSSWDSSEAGAEWGADAESMRSYSCPSCGAELMCEATTAATQCPYCGNPTIVPGQLSGGMKPNYVIPFKLDKNSAIDALKKHFGRHLFLPGSFKSQSQLKKIQGIYVPFWLFDGSVEAECSFHASNVSTYREGDYRVTRTAHYDVERGGTVSFAMVPTDASKKMPDDLMDSLEPFDYKGLKAFSMAYLPGYLADKYDVSLKESSERADSRCRSSAKELMRRDVTGYGSVSLRSARVSINRGKVHYALLPVWMLKVKWANQEYTFAMNGQTGKMVGNLPVSEARFRGFVAALGLVLAVLFYLLRLGPGIAWLIVSMLQEI